MKRILLIVILAASGWYGWGKYQAYLRTERASGVPGPLSRKAASAAPAKGTDPRVSFFSCDGRTACTQMTSCEEVRFFLKNCSGMNWEASGEGQSCQTQWCK